MQRVLWYSVTASGLARRDSIIDAVAAVAAPAAKDEPSGLHRTRPSVPRTPSKKRVRQLVSTPTKSPHSPGTLLRQATLSFRSPAPTSPTPTGSAPAGPAPSSPSLSTPSEVRRTVREIDEQIQAELAAEQPSPSRAPRAEFGSVLTATQNAVCDSEVVVIRDSEDDSDSLLSLDELVGFTKKDDVDTDLSSPAELDDDAREKDRIKRLSLFTQPRPSERPGMQRLRDLDAQERSKRFNITKYLDNEADLRERDESLRETRIRYEAFKAQLEAERSGDGQKHLLESLMADDGKDEDAVARTMSAVSRTEALSRGKTFSFFGSSDLSHGDDGNARLPEYPEAAIPMKLWLPGDDDTRASMFLSGLVAELAAAERLSKAALSWVFQAVVAETDAYLRSAYIECLKRGSSWWTRTHLGAVDIQHCFQSLGARKVSVESGTAIEASGHALKKRSRGEQTLLLDVLDLLQELCLHMDFLALSALASIACRLAVDADLMASSQIPGRVESLLATLLDVREKEARVFVADQILDDMSKNLQDAGLQSLLLTHILPTSQTASQLRLRLSHCFLLGRRGPTAAVSSAPLAIDLAALMNHVATDASFNTAQPSKLDFAAVRARTAILDTAISDGGRPAAFATPSDRASFNKSVDAVAAVVKDTFVRISDSGASHMSRTEAKDGLQALYYRLLFAVRTERPPRRNIFDPRSGRLREGRAYRDEQRRQEFMHGFLAKARQRQVQEARQADGPAASSSPQELSETERAIRRQLESSQ
ncbi:hypothetical protein DV737_g333, partial [Chaetothyriales sp. CBS 132003]